MEISKSYTKVEWRDDLMLMCKKAGAEPCVPSVFLFSDTQITDEGFVEDINNVLNSGEVTNLLKSFQLDLFGLSYYELFTLLSNVGMSGEW